jgi:hypothetical protein
MAMRGKYVLMAREAYEELIAKGLKDYTRRVK